MRYKTIQKEIIDLIFNHQIEDEDREKPKESHVDRFNILSKELTIK